MTQATATPAQANERRVRVAVKFSDQQAKAWGALHDATVSEVMYGGAKGGGKSVLGCFWCYARALELIQQYKLGRRKHPIPVGFMGRKQGKDFRDTTLETWKRFIPPEAYEIHEQAGEIIIAGAVKIVFGGLDRQEDLHKFNSAEFAFIFIDQAEETTRDDVSVLRASLRLRLDATSPPPAYKTLFTANPARCWLRDEFILAPSPGQVYIPALPSDNPFLPESYTKTLLDAFKHRPELLEAYLHGNWDAFDGQDQVIREKWIIESVGRRFYPDKFHRLIACDPARFGDDETVIFPMEDTQIVEKGVFPPKGEPPLNATVTIHGQKDAMHTANVLFRMWREYGAELVVIDEIGNGGPIGDRLVEMGVPVLMVNAAASASDKGRYYNTRAQLWFEAADMFCEGSVALAYQEPTLRGQLATPRYEYRNGRLLVEDKESIKDRLSRSPDRGDCYVMGLAGLRWLKGDNSARSCPGLTIKRPRPLETATPPANSYAGRKAFQHAEAERSRSW